MQTESKDILLKLMSYQDTVFGTDATVSMELTYTEVSTLICAVKAMHHQAELCEASIRECIEHRKKIKEKE